MEQVIKDFENYTINEFGLVRNTITNCIKKPTSNNSGKGYLYVDLYNKGKKKRFYIHRLVAKYFIENVCNKPFVNHIDGNTKNNNVSNLEWCTPLENVEHASRVLNVMTAYKNANRNKQRAVAQIDYKTKQELARFESIREASRQTGIKSEYITQICKGKFRQAFGYTWCYVEDLGE